MSAATGRLIMTATSKQPGAALRRLRQRDGLSLGEVSRRTGISVSILSKVEHGRLGLSYRRLAQLSEGLDIDVARLFEAPDEDASATEIAPTGRRSIHRAGDPAAPQPGAELLHRRLTPRIVDLPPRASKAPALTRLAGDVFAFVVEGEAVLHTDIYAPLQMGVGDSIYFDGATAHAWVNAGSGPCRVLTVSSGDAA